MLLPSSGGNGPNHVPSQRRWAGLGRRRIRAERGLELFPRCCWRRTNLLGGGAAVGLAGSGRLGTSRAAPLKLHGATRRKCSRGVRVIETRGPPLPGREGVFFA